MALVAVPRSFPLQHGRSRVASGGPVLDSKCRHLAKVGQVPGEERQVSCEGDGRDAQVHCCDPNTAATERVEPGGRRIVKWEYLRRREVGENLLEHLVCADDPRVFRTPAACGAE